MVDDDRKTEDKTSPDAGAESPSPAKIEAAPAAAGPARAVPDMAVSDELQRAMEEAAAVVNGPRAAAPADAPAAAEPATASKAEPRVASPVEPQPFDPNQPPAPAEPPPAEPSKKEMELKMQILDLRQQLRNKDKEVEQRLKDVKQNAEQARMLQSQLEGSKVRAMKEKADWFNYGHEPVLKELLQVVDNLERALVHGAKDTDPAALCAGVDLIQRQLLAVLAKFGATPMETKGQPFNPEAHQAMSQVEDDSVPPGTVVEEYQKGYRLKDRLLRPAMVLVSRASAEAEAGSKDKDPAGGD